MAEALLFEHEDGRYAVNPDTTGDPKWHRVGPVNVSALSTNAGEAAPVAFDAFLCRAWGETDMPCAELVRDWDGVRRFMIREWLGEEDGEQLLQLKDDFDKHEEDMGRNGGPLSYPFEIGGVSVERVCGFAHPPAAVHGQSASTEASAGWLELQDDPRVNEIVSGLYRRFKDWSQRGFSADDVTWCEVKADVIRLIEAAPAQAAIDAREQEDYPEGFDASCGIPARFLQEANMTCASLTGDRTWDVKCVAAALQSAALASRDAAPAPAAAGGVKDERAAFEAWAHKLGHDIHRSGGTGYLRHTVQVMWMAWQARAALAQPAPVQPTIINGEPAAAHSLLAALVDIHDDAAKYAPENRCYVEEAWPDALKAARAFLAAPVQPEAYRQGYDQGWHDKACGSAHAFLSKAAPVQQEAATLDDATCDRVIRAVLLKLDAFTWSETTVDTRDAVRAALTPPAVAAPAQAGETK